MFWIIYTFLQVITSAELSPARLDTLTAVQLDDLGEALLDFQTVADLQQWLDQH